MDEYIDYTVKVILEQINIVRKQWVDSGLTGGSSVTGNWTLRFIR